MKSRFFRVTLFVSALLLTACGADINKWGEAKVYDDFLWKKCEPDTLKRTIVIQLNPDAAEYGFRRTPRLGFYANDEQGRRVAIRDAEFFVDGKKIGGNTFAIPYVKGESEISLEVGILFNDDAPNDTYLWYLDLADAGDLDRINYEPVSSYQSASQRDYGYGIEKFEVIKDKIMNPLLVLILALVSIVIVGVLIVRIICHASHPKFKQSKITLFGPSPYSQTIYLKGCYKVVLTNNRNLRQSAFCKFFSGKIQYVVNPLWTTNVEFTPNGSQGAIISYDNQEFYCDGRMLKKGEIYNLRRVNSRDVTKITLS